MKLIKVSVNGLHLFKEGVELDFIAQQRVTENNSNGLSQLTDNIYRQNVLGIIGINASGKTTVLKALSFVLDIYLQQGKLNHEKFEFLWNEERITVEAYLYNENKQLIKVQSIIKRNKKNQLYFEEEKIWKKKIGTVKKSLYTFSNKHIDVIRSKENSPYLADDMSIMIALTKNSSSADIINLISETNKNTMKTVGRIPVQMVNYLDKSIEYLREERDANNNVMIRLKFTGQDRVILLKDLHHLETYLSSGTIKGLNVLTAVETVLKTGGILIVDEIENHFNKEIVRTIIKFFKNEHTNPNGAVLVFSTHYSELLDDFERNDSIYFTLKEEQLRLKNLNDLLNRSDYKKSEVYQSSYLGSTAPSYHAYMDLKNIFRG